MQNKKNYFLRFRTRKMDCEFTYTTNAFQDESRDFQTSFVMKEVEVLLLKY